MQKVIDFANYFKSEIHFLKVTTPSKFTSTEEATQQVKDFIKDLQLPNYSINIYNDSTIQSGILNFSRNIEADLIALTTHGRSGLSQLFTPSVTKNLTKNAMRPILTIKS